MQSELEGLKTKAVQLVAECEAPGSKEAKTVEEVIEAMPLLASLPPGAIDSVDGQVAVQALRGALHAIASLRHMSVDRVPEIIQPMAGQAAAHNPVGNTRDDELEEEGDETMLGGTALGPAPA